jgi:hypothetical protein
MRAIDAKGVVPASVRHESGAMIMRNNRASAGGAGEDYFLSR